MEAFVTTKLTDLCYRTRGKYFDRVEWLCRCGLAPYLEQLQHEVEILKNLVNEEGICMAPIAENQFKGFSTYGGQQLETDWKTSTRRFYP